jgi:hypothetical protein
MILKKWCLHVTDLASLIESARIKAIQEALWGFLLDEVINTKGEFYVDHRISVGQLDPNRADDGDKN